MELKVEKIKETIILNISGRLDATNAKELEDKILKIVEEGDSKFVANLADLEYISSAGLRVFLLVAKKISGKGQISLCNLQKQINEVFEMSGFSTIFNVFDGIDEALAG